MDKLLQWLRGSFWSQTLESGFDCVVRKEGQRHKLSDVATCHMISGVRSLQIPAPAPFSKGPGSSGIHSPAIAVLGGLYEMLPRRLS